MLPIKDNLTAKTGTLSDLSAIAGYLTSKSGKKYTFCIMINDMKLSASDKKMLDIFGQICYNHRVTINFNKGLTNIDHLHGKIPHREDTMDVVFEILDKA